MLKEMFKKTGYITLPGRQKAPSVPEGLWIKCPKCQEMLYREDVVGNFYTCGQCGNYFRIKAKNRIRMLADSKSFEEWDKGLLTTDPLEYPEYKEKLKGLQEKTKLDEAVVTGKLTIDKEEAVVGVCDVRFLMGSMGYVVGEKLTRAIEKATEQKLPLILFTCSGGARMQEGIVSLMQMAKTSAALKKHSDAGLFYLTILTDPTTGGVTASFAMLGDIILAEPGALIGFAGPRVIEQTIGQKLPEGFQRPEFLLEHGIIDGIVERENLKETIVSLIRLHKGGKSKGADIGDFREAPQPHRLEQAVPEEKTKGQREKAASRIQPLKRDLPKTAWERVQTARGADRPTSLDYIHTLFPDFMELHGDRAFRDDGAVVGGIASFCGRPVTVIGQQKGKTTKENITRNFGMPYPEGYRKALRLMKQAEKFNRPVICFVDTPGAFCGPEAEERGQGEAIARNLLEMSGLQVPILSIVIGEGGSGGALALALGNEVWMMENATYSILSPEGFASILWKDSSKAQEAAEKMKLTAKDLKKLGIIEAVIGEEQPAGPVNLPVIAAEMGREIMEFLERYGRLTGQELTAHRYERFRNM